MAWLGGRDPVPIFPICRHDKPGLDRRDSLLRGWWQLLDSYRVMIQILWALTRDYGRCRIPPRPHTFYATQNTEFRSVALMNRPVVFGELRGECKRKQ